MAAGRIRRPATRARRRRGVEALSAADIVHALSHETEAVERALVRIADRYLAAEPVGAAARYALLGGGKRLRPVLCLAAYRAAGGASHPSDNLCDAAAALELIHTYSLVHDDLPCMDNDDLRRGRATTHRVYGSGAAILAGVTLIPLACRLLYQSALSLGLDRPGAASAVRELTRGAGAAGMVGGQVLDLQAEGSVLSPADLYTLHGAKTGALFAASLRVGGRLARASDEACAVLGEFGLRLGLAFQAADDVLDVTKEAAVLGKTPGKDAQAEKATFVTQLGVDGARRAARSEAAAAVAALRAGRLESPLLEALAEFAVHRDR